MATKASGQAEPTTEGVIEQRESEFAKLYNGVTLHVTEVFFGTNAVGAYGRIRGRVVRTGDEVDCWLPGGFIVNRLQQRIVDLPFNLQLKKVPHPDKPDVQMWSIQLLTFPGDK